MLALYRDLLSLRREYAALAIGSFHPVAAEGDVLAFERHHGDQRLCVVLNLGACEGMIPLEARRGRTLLSTLGPSPSDSGAVLRPNEGLILALAS